MKAKAVEWQKANPEKKQASDHKQAIKPENQCKLRERMVRWAQDNPEKAKAVARANYLRYAERHPDHLKISQARHRKTEKYRQNQKRYRQTPQAKAYHREHQRMRRRLLKGIVSESNRGVRRRGTTQVLTVSQWQEVLEYFGHRCAYCNGAPERLEIDHIIPVTRGGQHTPDNVVPACRSCNARKGNRPLVQMLTLDPAPILVRAFMG